MHGPNRSFAHDSDGSHRATLLGLALLFLGACSSSAVQKAPNEPPSPANPASITLAEPGGDAENPHDAALARQLAAPWGERMDRDEQVRVPLPDWELWKRVRYRGVEHFAGFRYGKEHHVMAILFVQDVPPSEPVDTRNCLRRFELWASPQMTRFDVKLGPVSEVRTSWKNQQIAIHRVDGSLSFAFTKRSFSAAWAAYPAYPDACLVYAMAAPWGERPELAQRLRDRWVSEGFQALVTTTPTKAFRH